MLRLENLALSLSSEKQTQLSRIDNFQYDQKLLSSLLFSWDQAGRSRMLLRTLKWCFEYSYERRRRSPPFFHIRVLTLSNVSSPFLDSVLSNEFHYKMVKRGNYKMCFWPWVHFNGNLNVIILWLSKSELKI